ncbi:phosphoadenylyl-sulfate reductase [Jiulongibacter sp. NS-SX5]|uniref:phosphoadenylyl-sulfate reductase n=1 Tax=Jiulongibacter sp. NS-SX5 TaxID=3463854 RepID=UPI00405A40C2
MTKDLENKSLEERLQWVVENHKNIVFSSSFGQEDQAISHAIFWNDLDDIQVFTLDTGRHFQETYEVMDRTRSRYKKNIKTYFPNQEQVEELLDKKGYNSFFESVENRKECCFIRKIVPLKRALKDADVWITGLRAEQSDNRQDMPMWEWDEANQVHKFNPLIDWSFDQMEAYLKENRVPQNSLHKKGFVSIGCQPCTRAIMEDEHPRAGRWYWEESKKECGLHAVK